MDKVNDFKVVNKSVDKIDSMQLALGKPSFVADLVPEDALIIKLLGSPHPHARIRSIDTSAAEAMPGVITVVTGDDFPFTFGLYMKDRYVFAQRRVRFVGEQVAAVVARDLPTAKRAAQAVRVTYEELSQAGLEPGAQAVRALSPAEGFGERDESRILEGPRAQLPPDVTVGSTVASDVSSLARLTTSATGPIHMVRATS